MTATISFRISLFLLCFLSLSLSLSLYLYLSISLISLYFCIPPIQCRYTMYVCMCSMYVYYVCMNAMYVCVLRMYMCYVCICATYVYVLRMYICYVCMCAMYVWMLSMYGCVLWLYAINVCLHIFACVRSPHPLACLSSECLFWLTLALSVSQDCLSLEGCEPKTRLLSLLFVSSFCL